jgi:4-hydroxyacetophenone monooxygenase
VDAAHEQMVWTHPGMDTYYRNSKGRVVVNNPFKIVDYWKLTKRMDPSEFEAEPRRGVEAVGAGQRGAQAAQ